MEDQLKKSRQETRDAFKSRGTLYRLIFEEMSNEFGEDKSINVLKKAIFRWGGIKSAKYRNLAENKDFKGIANEFMKSSVCGGELFKPTIATADTESAVLDMENCPLVEAWREMGLSSDETRKMCDIANATDYGKYQGMGLDLKIESTIANDQDRCRLLISKTQK